MSMSEPNAQPQKLALPTTPRNAYYTFSHISNHTNNYAQSNLLAESAELNTGSCSSPGTKNNRPLSWSAQCASPASPFPKVIVQQATTLSTPIFITTTTTTAATTTLASTAKTTTTFSTFALAITTATSNTSTNLAQISPATTKYSYTPVNTHSNTSNVEKQARQEKSNNDPTKLKRSRDKQSPSNIPEPNTNTKKQKKKTQNTTQTTLQKYWLSAPTSTNMFELLAEENDSGLETNSYNQNKNTDETSTTKETVKIPKPPPIYVEGVEQIKALNCALIQAIGKNYILKTLRNNEVRIQTNESIHYTAVTKMLKEKQTKFYTFKLKEERNFKVVLRNLHPFSDPEEIKTELSELGHDIQQVYNIKQKHTNKPLPLFFIEIKQKNNNNEIYNITSLLQTKVIVEPPHHKRTIAQCSNCQKYGHTRNFCTRDPVCVKCAGKHKTLDCTVPTTDGQVKCALCSGNHTANYKGCEIYKALKIQRFPALRHKTNNVHDPATQPKSAVSHEIRPDISYADAAAQNLIPKPKNAHTRVSTPTPSRALELPVKTPINNKQNDEMGEIKDMLKQLIQQISNMMGVINTLLTQFGKTGSKT